MSCTCAMITCDQNQKNDWQKAEVKLSSRLKDRIPLPLCEVGQDSGLISWACVFQSEHLKNLEIHKGRYGVLGVVFCLIETLHLSTTSLQKQEWADPECLLKGTVECLLCARDKTPFPWAFPSKDVADCKSKSQENVSDVQEKIGLGYPDLHFKKPVR